MANEINNSGSVGSKSGKSIHKSYRKNGFIPLKQLNGYNDVNTIPGTNPIISQEVNFERQKNLLNKYKNNQYNFQYGLQLGYGIDEDPVMFGFDLVIDNQSPLIKEVPEFIKIYGTQSAISEVKNRGEVYNKFLAELFKYFGNSNYASEFSGQKHRAEMPFGNFKAHYIKSVSGLDKLIEKSLGGIKPEQQFTKWTDDVITIDMFEDTNINIGYLAFLYRILSYSRIRGKTIIPDNLLRFDMKVIISEVRNFNRIVNNPNDVESYKDNVSRYIYSLYDCQFNFKSLTHEDKVSNEQPAVTDSYKFDIAYKFSTLRMEKFEVTQDTNGNANYDRNIYDNRYSTSYFFKSLPYPELDTPNSYDLPYREKRIDELTFNKRTPTDTRKEASNQNITSSEQQDFITTEKEKEKQNNQYKPPTNIDSALDGLDEGNVGRNLYNDGVNVDSALDGLDEGDVGRNLYNDGVNVDSALDGLDEGNVGRNLYNDDVINAQDGGGLGEAIDNTRSEIARRFKLKREQLIDDTLAKVRTATGFRRISSPINVYQEPTIVNFAFNQFKDFVNDQISQYIANSPFSDGSNSQSLREQNEEYNRRIGGDLSGDR